MLPRIFGYYPIGNGCHLGAYYHGSFQTPERKLTALKSMLQNSTELYGNRIAATDGDVGTVEDLYFDDKHWVIRYIVAETGSWLSGRPVLLSPHSLSADDVEEKTLHVNLRKKQIQDSPPIDSHIPISRQYEVDYYRYYGLPVYWSAGSISDLGSDPTGGTRSKAEIEMHFQHRRRDDRHLQSSKAVTGFHIQTLDGLIGHVSGFLVDDRTWSIPALVVEAGHWYSEKEVLISANNVDRISYEDSTVFINLTRAAVQKTLETSVVTAGAGEYGRNHFYD